MERKNVKGLDEILKAEVERGFVTGANALVYHKNREIYYGEAGVRNLETGEPMARDTIVRLFSMSKPVTAVAVMILCERGVLSPGDPLERYLPEYAPSKLRVALPDGSFEPVRQSIRLSDLMHMTSGIPYPDSWHEPGRRMGELFDRLIGARLSGKCVTTGDYAREIAGIPLCFQPGEGWMYGLSADLLGAVIEAATGLTYDEYLKKEIFEPLGMKDTAFAVPKEKLDRFAVAYDWGEDNVPKPFTKSALGEYYGEDVAFLSGGAGLVSTLDDYMRFARLLTGLGTLRENEAEGGSTITLLKPETVEWMRRDALLPVQRKDFLWDTMKGYGYGCLMRTLIDPVAAGSPAPVGEFGWDGWMGCYMLADPGSELAVVYQIQRAGAGTTEGAIRFRNEVYRCING